MCGIAGILNLNGEPVSTASLRRMTDVLAHRGPDGEGFFVHGPIGLGHRRLAIIDLSAAASQPMTMDARQLVITYNGEIYNFRDLRAELEAAGHQFRSRADTEVVLHAYAEWGDASLLRFNGMFAFALWDGGGQRLFLARDRYGIKPLYYALCGSTLLFASEVKAILAHPAFRVSLNREALLQYFTFQNVFTDDTLFDGVRLLAPGTWLSIPASAGAVARPRRYWDYAFDTPERLADEREYVEELDRLFGQAVRRHLVADVEVGSYLSGGVDSGGVTAIASSELPTLKTFTCGFDLHSASGLELAFDEREKAELMSYVFRTEHYEMVLKAGDMERVLSKLIWHLDEPRIGQSYPNYYASQLASKFVKVVLAGTGGDELFAGYPWRYYRALASSSFEDYIDRYYLYWQRLIPNSTIRRLFRPIWGDVARVWTRDIFRDVFETKTGPPSRPEDYINASLYFEAKTFLHGLLIVEDKLSMAHGLETRLPFLDNDLVEFAMQVPVRLKLSNLAEVVRLNENDAGPKTARYFAQTKDGKLLLRKMMARHVPDEVASGLKQGFSAPDASWFRGESIDYVRRRLLTTDCVLHAFLDRDVMRDLVHEHLEGRQNRRLLIWSLLSFEEWCRRFLGGT